MTRDDLLMGELMEFKRATLERLDLIESKTDSFQSFRFKITGMAAIISFVVSSVGILLVEWFKK